MRNQVANIKERIGGLIRQSPADHGLRKSSKIEAVLKHCK